MSGVRGLMNSGFAPEVWSGIYETAPVGFTDQPPFLNMTLRARTEMDPWETLLACQAAEANRNRERVLRWGPRTLDIDILLYDHLILRDERLTLPHPRMKERSFVLIPLKEMDPEVFEQLKCGLGAGEVRLYRAAEDVIFC
jgi:2-amino-4-hydroxy-6-hydroxymethyldihydropteridine diphosphokinase